MGGGDERTRPGGRPGTCEREDCAVQLGLIGLGKMGGNMAERLRRAVTRSSATNTPRTSGTSTACPR
jgi:hypothetical protein